MSQGIRTIDLFCGAGGSSYGARNAGANIIAGFDIWEPAIRTYKANFSDAFVFQQDIREINPQKIKDQIGSIDLMLASPECTNHSVAKGAKERSEESKRTVFEVIRFAKVFQPKWLVIENVIQMKSWSEHPRLLGELWRLGYFVKEVKLNSKDYGVPQARERLFLLCTQAEEASFPKPLSENRVPASSIIDTSDKYKFTPLYSLNRAKKTLERAERAFSEVGKNEPFLLVYYGTDGSGGWQTIDKPLRTITTLDRFAYVVPGRDGHLIRMLQPEELKLAMGFKIDFNLDLNLTRRQKIKLMGNGVCPPVMESIVHSLIKHL